jgi:hypothetical protein
MQLLLPLAMVCLLCLLIGSGFAQQGADFYVSPQGDDAWSGTLAAPAGDDGPFATLARAQQAMRAARAQAPDRALTCLVRGGTYRLSEPLVFTPEDSGSEGAPVTYAAFAGERPVFSGGEAITGWEQGDGEAWVTEIPAALAGDWYFHQLFVNGERRTRARTPNEGYFHIADTLEPMTDRTAARSDDAFKMGFRYTEGDLQPVEDMEDVNIILYHAWTASVHWIEELDEQNRIVRFTAPCGWPVGYWDAKARYEVENCLEALDTPGEWYLQRSTGRLYYWPLPGEDLTEAEIIAPRLQHLVQVRGDTQLGLPVSHLILRGLRFCHADWKHDRNRSADGQAAVHLSAAIVATGALNCTLEDCEVAHVGEYGVILGEGCKGNRLVKCHIHDLGGGGVRLGETNLPPEPHRQADHNTVDNCFIHDGGHVFRAGIGVWIGRSSYNTVSHNEICDFYYSGCSVGWSWGYAESTAHHNLFEYNHIHNIGKGVLSDMGGIYSLGLSPGTVERNNVIHDVYSYSYGGWGLYTDEGSTGIVMEDNVVYNTKSGGFHQHYGKENVLRNNIIAFAREGNVIRSREEEHSSFTFERNIVLTNHGMPLGGNWGNGNFEMDYNLYWDTEDPGNIDFSGLDLVDWQAEGHDVHSRIADPLFVDAQGGDFRLKEGSPAFELGFKQIDTSTVGLYGDAEWVAAPGKIVRKPIELPPIPQPQRVEDDFETTAVGERPAGANVSGEDRGASIRVSDERAASGRHSLKFVDAPGLPHDWQPHMYYRPKITKGLARASCSVYMEPGAILWHEWRDTANPYNAGPSLRIEGDGTISVKGETVARIPHGQWVRLEVTCGLGSASTGDFELSVTVPGEDRKVIAELPVGSERFRRLEWLGFISLATSEAVFYIDDLKLERVEQ